MRPLSKASLAFCATYVAAQERREQAAREVHDAIQLMVQPLRVYGVAVEARAKGVVSLRGKLRGKRYKRPADQLMDSIGARIVTCFERDTPQIVAAIKNICDIRASHSEDKMDRMKVGQFGYRSIHLIARLPRGGQRLEAYLELGRPWVEIQVRSLLQHAWAAVGHDILYKGGVRFSEDETRAFHALAGTLETIDTAFDGLRKQRLGLFHRYREVYTKGEQADMQFDLARLVGFLKAKFPDGAALVSDATGWSLLGAGLDLACLDALRMGKIATAATLSKAMASKKCIQLVDGYAKEAGVMIGQVAHLVRVVCAVDASGKVDVAKQFPELLQDQTMLEVMRSVGAKSEKAKKKATKARRVKGSKG